MSNVDRKIAAARIRAVVRPWQEALGAGSGLTTDQVNNGIGRLLAVAEELDPLAKPPVTAGVSVSGNVHAFPSPSDKGWQR